MIMKLYVLNFLIMLTLLASSVIHAAMFVPVPIERQISEADGYIRGSYQGLSYKKLPTGEVVSELSFRVSESNGINIKNFLNTKEFKVLIPGGKWQGIVYDVSGAPSFNMGEEVALLLKKEDQNYWISNLSLGKYTLVKKTNSEFLKSSVFPNHPKLGHISYIDFKNMSLNTHGDHVVNNVSRPKMATSELAILAQKKKSKSNRKIASDNRVEIVEDRTNQYLLWFLVIFILLFVVSLYLKRKGY